MDRRYLKLGARLSVLSMLVFIGLALYWGDLDKSTVLILYVSSFVLVLAILFSTFGNLIFATRLFLLFIVGAYPLGVKLVGEELYFSVFEFNTQSLSVATVMYALTLLAVVGAFLGFKAGSGADINSYRVARLPEFDRYYFGVFVACAVFAVLAGTLIIMSSTGTILDVAYGSGTEGLPLIGSASAMGGISISVMFYCCLAARRRSYWVVFTLIAIYVLLWCQILRGLRQDVVSALFACAVLFMIFRLRDISIKVKYFGYLIPLFVALELWGLVRTGLNLYLDGELSVQELLELGFGNAATISDVVYSSTLGPIATTFANVVALFEWGEIDVIYGAGYIDYLLRIPPEFIYSGRPQDYANMFTEYGLSSGGGFFELAEAYLNFGVVGVLLVPFIISFIIAKIYSKALGGFNIIYIFALSSILSVWLRGSWYQTFAFFKASLTGLVMYLVIHMIATLAAKSRNQRH